MRPNEPSPAMLAFLRESAPDEVLGEIPASEEELRFEAAWSEMLARKRRIAQQGVQAANEVVTEPFDLATLQLYRRPSRKPAYRRLAVAVVAAIVIGGLSLAIRPHWSQPGPKPSPDIVKKDPVIPKGPESRLVDKGKGATVKPLPPFEDALAGLKKRLQAGMDEQEARLAYNKLLEDYPGYESKIKNDPELALAAGLPVPPIVNNPIKAPESGPPPVAKNSSLEEIKARIADAGNPPPPRDDKVRESREQALRFREEHPELKIPEIEAFIVASEPSPSNELRYAEARAKAVEKSSKDSAEVKDLRGIVFALRFRNDETRRLLLSNKVLDGFMKLTQVDDLASKAVEMKAAVLALVERLSPKGRGPYLLCVLPPPVRNEAENLYRDVQTYARRSVDPPDAVFVDFLTRARRPQGDTLGVIMPTYDPNRFRIGTPVGDDNWNRLIRAGNPDVPITAVVNIVINREVLQREDAVVATIDRAKAASISTLACLDCRPAANKSDRNLTDEIDSWFVLYGNLDGYYIYGADINRFKTLYNYIRNKYRDIPIPIIVYSVTEFPPEDLIKANLSDNQFAVCIEQEATPIDNFKPPGWIVRYNPNRFAGVFQATRADLATSIELAAAKHLGSVYLTDNGLQVPEYLLDEAALIRQLNARIIGTRTANNPPAKKKKTADPQAK